MMPLIRWLNSRVTGFGSSCPSGDGLICNKATCQLAFVSIHFMSVHFKNVMHASTCLLL